MAVEAGFALFQQHQAGRAAGAGSGGRVRNRSSRRHRDQNRAPADRKPQQIRVRRAGVAAEQLHDRHGAEIGHGLSPVAIRDREGIKKARSSHAHGAAAANSASP